MWSRKGYKLRLLLSRSMYASPGCDPAKTSEKRDVNAKSAELHSSILA
jgi:hypothetical protein